MFLTYQDRSTPLKTLKQSTSQAHVKYRRLSCQEQSSKDYLGGREKGIQLLVCHKPSREDTHPYASQHGHSTENSASNLIHAAGFQFLPLSLYLPEATLPENTKMPFKTQELQTQLGMPCKRWLFVCVLMGGWRGRNH